MEKFDELWKGGPGFYQPEGVFKLGSDSVLLADFAVRGRGGRACDLGCGGGIIGILLIAFGGDYRVDCVDIQPQAVEAAKRNIEANGYSDRMTAVLGDIRACRELWEAGSFDLTVSNPPYFVSGSGRSAKEESIAAARDERSCSLSEVCAAAAYLTRWGGRFAMVHRPERAAEVICAMSAAGLESKRMRTVHSRAGAAPSLILLEGRRGGKPGLVFEPPLILKTDGGEHSEEIKRIYHIGLEAEA